jgi:5-methylthioadenosine/S-adenosylhomocysteine deaminase
MTYKQYTHDIVIKNSKEFISNGVIIHKTGDTDIAELCSANQIHTETKPLKTIAVPGFINLHCHLIHTNIQLKSQELFSWLKELVKHNSNIPQMVELEAPKKSALTGAIEALSYGTTFIVDNTDNLSASYQALSTTKLRGLIGLEIFGSDPASATQKFNTAESLLSNFQKELSSDQNNKISFCLSPHACYDVSHELWRLILAYAQKTKSKILSHIAESTAEETWFQDKDSHEAQSAREFWASINTLEPKLKNWKAYKSSVDFLKQNALLDSSMLLAHAVHASEEDLLDLIHKNVNLVTCPRSNLYLKNGLPNYQTWEKHKINYGIGTDSKASNYDLDLRKELQAIQGLSVERKFELLTSSPAEILARKDLGKLEAGGAGDWLVLELINKDIDILSINPYELALDPALTKVKEVFIANDCVYRNKAFR